MYMYIIVYNICIYYNIILIFFVFHRDRNELILGNFPISTKLKLQTPNPKSQTSSFLKHKILL